MPDRAATYVLIRHGATDFTGTRLLGRDNQIGLSAAGHQEALELARRLTGEPIEAVFSSPVLRALQTAAPLSDALGLKVAITDAFTELDFGDWTGRSFSDLEDDAVWRRFNTFRSSTRIPNGEHLLDAQRRAVDQLEAWREEYVDKTIAVVSHADVIRAVLTYYLGAPLDLMLRLRLDPASVSVLSLYEWGPVVSRINAFAISP